MYTTVKCGDYERKLQIVTIGFTSGWADAAKVVKCGVMSGAVNLMKAPLFPICMHTDTTRVSSAMHMSFRHSKQRASSPGHSSLAR